MKPRVTLRKALEDPELLGSALAGPTWHAWRALLVAAMGEALTPDELGTFKTFTGRDAPPSQRVDELWCCVGRRGGKSRAMAVLAVYLAGLCDYTDKLAKGEKGVVLLIAPDKKQAKVLLDYAEGTLQSTPMLSQLLEARTAETLTLTTGIVLEVRSASFRRIRGLTCVAVLGDEVAFWMSDDSVNPDIEILNAARPALATTQGPLICISSPYARRGALWEAHKRHYGPDGDPAILVAQGANATSTQTYPSQLSTGRWSGTRLLQLPSIWPSSESTLKASSRANSGNELVWKQQDADHRYYVGVINEDRQARGLPLIEMM